ncbi:MAG: YlxM family DNA-binding protein [Lachnospiraceae bacterium]|nr:YlxM family DNA-binding protein [Lachnospiraceae bacterium]
MDRIFERNLLYDFYGELLTAHQRNVYEAVVYNDMSLSEIAEEQGISRQGVHDLIKRCDKLLQDYESKLHLVERFTKAKEKIHQIDKLTRGLEEMSEKETVLNTKDEQEAKLMSVSERMQRIRELSRELMKEW